MGGADRKVRKRLQQKRREHDIPLAEYSKPDHADVAKVPPPVIAKARGKAYRKRMRATSERMRGIGERLSLRTLTQAMDEVDKELDGK